MAITTTTRAPEERSLLRRWTIGQPEAKGAAGHEPARHCGARHQERRRHDHSPRIQARAWDTEPNAGRGNARSLRARRSVQGSRAHHAPTLRREVVSAARGGAARDSSPRASNPRGFRRTGRQRGGAFPESAGRSQDEISQGGTKGKGNREQARIWARSGETRRASRFFRRGRTPWGCGAQNTSRFLTWDFDFTSFPVDSRAAELSRAHARVKRRKRDFTALPGAPARALGR